MKKQLFISFILLFSSMMAFAQSDDIPNGQTADSQRAPGFIEYTWQLVVWQKDGSKTMFLLDERPRVVYEGDKVIVKSSSTVEYDFHAIKKMTYSMEEVSGIREMATKEGMPFSASDGTITFVPTQKDLHVRIFLTSGMMVNDFTVGKDETTTITLNSSPEKIYLVNVNGVTYKIKIR